MSQEEKINYANQIASAIAKKYGISTEDLVSGKRHGELPHVRRMINFFIRNNTQLKLKVLAPIVGFRRPNSSAVAYKRVKNESRINDRVKADLMAINSVFK